MTVSPMASATTSRPNLRPEPMIQSIDDDLLAGRTRSSPALVALRRTLSAPASEGHQRTVWCRPAPFSTPGLTHPRHQRRLPRTPCGDPSPWSGRTGNGGQAGVGAGAEQGPLALVTGHRGRAAEILPGL